MKELAILIPALGRPHTIKPVYRSAMRTTPNARVLFICSDFDLTVKMAVESVGAEYIEIPYKNEGDYARKINAGFEYTDEPLVFTGATDIVFYPNWFEHAKREVDKGFHVVGTNDLGHRDTMTGQHSTHTLVTREYVEKYGLITGEKKVLCEEYIHEFVDDELVGTAKHRGMYSWSKHSIVEHLHPAWKKTEWDDMYTHQGIRMQLSQHIYEQRRLLWT